MNDEAYQVATPLFRAIEKGDADKVKDLLEQGADPHEVHGEDEDSALLIAAIEGKVTIARLLLEAGADPNLGDACGYTPLMGAVCADSLAMVRLLLEQGADVNRRCSRSGATALQDAAIGGHVHVAQALLKAGADPHAPETKEGLTTLMCAVQSLSPETVRLLLSHGADPSITSSRQDTALSLARNLLDISWQPNKRQRAETIIRLLSGTSHVAD